MSGNPNLKNIADLAAKDIIELQTKIAAFKSGQMDEERFKHYRLTRGVYGQRQLGVHMFRTKIPFGKLTTDQLITLANISEKYTFGNLHLTTRQNIQLHHVKLKDSPAIWTEMAQADLTAREACGNTVRNLTASANAGIDPDELFDVSPYVQATFEYFLRNPICQEMGRKIKPAFSSSDKDSAYTYFHDFGLIPRIKVIDGKEERGFKVVIGGGLGALSIVAQTAYEFLHEDQIIPFMEATIRVFDRYGERQKRQKARMKFLVKQLGLEGFMELVEAERISIKNKTYKIDRNTVPVAPIPDTAHLEAVEPDDQAKYDHWLATNVFAQKQEGYFGVNIKVLLGDIHAEEARQFAAIVKKYAADDIRITVNQGFLLRYVKPGALPHLFNELDKIGLAQPGFNTIGDITACPGTDTCNLGVTNSTGLAKVLEEMLFVEYPHLVNESGIDIKISGCMNSCGQHMAAHIGFHGSSIKKGALVIPAMQVVLGGGVDENGKGFVAEKVIKLPTKRIPEAVRTVLNDYEDKATEGEYFNDYYYRHGKRYFYNLLKELANHETLSEQERFDWGEDSAYIQAIGVGECAGVAYDMVGAIIGDAHEKVSLSHEAIKADLFADSIYHSYAAFVIGAKALLLSQDVKCNAHKGIISDFQTHYVDNGAFKIETENFGDLVLQINKQEPSEDFARQFNTQATAFFNQVVATREAQLKDDGDKEVISNYYNA